MGLLGGLSADAAHLTEDEVGSSRLTVVAAFFNWWKLGLADLFITFLWVIFRLRKVYGICSNIIYLCVCVCVCVC